MTNDETGSTCATLSLTPGFSPVLVERVAENRFNGFPFCPNAHERRGAKTVETVLEFTVTVDTRLKPGVNEMEFSVFIRG